MEKADSKNALRVSIDPCDLYDRLVRSLGLIPIAKTPAEITSLPMPSFHKSNFRDLYLVKEVLRKYPGFDLGIDRAQVAYSAFLEQEQVNRITNERLSSRQVPEKGVLEVFDLAKRKVPVVLRDFNWDSFLESVRHGPGATTRLGRREASLPNKLSGKPHVTRNAANLAYAVLQECPSWAYNCGDGSISQAELLTICNYDRGETASKSAHTDRFITIPPDMNVAMQLGVGTELRRALFRWGINLQDQTINRLRARKASKGQRNATVDLRNASNSIVSELVWRLIGDHDATRVSGGFLHWYKVLEALRSEGGMVDGTHVFYEMWSAMGNGYTFELETLVFWLLTEAVCLYLGIPPDVTVYGDDIVCPEEAVPLLRKVFDYCGFSLNTSKSFYNTEGPRFRESCGGHYLDGIDVTPFYVKDQLDIHSTILLMNNIKRWSYTGEGLDGRLRPVYDWLKDKLPPRARDSAIPFGEANDGLIKDFDEARPAVKLSRKRTNRSVATWFWSPDHLSIIYGKMVELPCNWTGQRIGYKARTCKVEQRGVAASGQLGVTSWLYQRDTKRFGLREEPDWHARDWRARRIVGNGRHLSVGESIKIPTNKKTTVYPKRVVPEWADTGGWHDVPPDTVVLDLVVKTLVEL